MKTPSIQNPCSLATLVVGLVLSMLSARLSAQVPAPPQRISYQGYLVDANGAPLGSPMPKNYDAVFRIYGASTGGESVWSEQQTITVDKGYFSVLLGEGGTVGAEPHAALDTVFSSGTAERYVGLTVKGLPTAAGIEIAPRIQLLTSPYAMVSAHAKMADQAKGVVNAAGASVLTITSAGGNKVGINKAAPAVPLDVVGDINSSATVRATTFEGALDAARLTGTIPAARLPGEFAKTNTANTFNANQTVNGTVKATKFHGMGAVPVGGIIMWSGIDKNLDNSGYAFCDGQAVTLEFDDGTTLATQTPDLRNRFILGSEGLYRTNSTVVSGLPKDIGKSGGSDTVTLTVGNLPPHTHAFHDVYWLADGEYFRRWSNASDGLDYVAGDYKAIPNGRTNPGYINEGGYEGGNATHAAYLASATTGTTSAASTPVTITPKYYRLAYIMRWK